MEDLFVYNDKQKALGDLMMFSDMNCNEDKPLYLIAAGAGWVISNKLLPGATVAAIGLNGSFYE